MFVTPGSKIQRRPRRLKGGDLSVIATSATITPQGRLTLASGVQVMRASQTAKNAVLWTPYGGNLIPLFDGTKFIPTPFAETSQATTDTTLSPGAVGASKIYDMFAWTGNNVTRGYDWGAGGGSNAVGSSARGSGVGSTELIWINGIPLNKYDITNGPAAQRGTFMGVVASNASSLIDYTFGSAGSGGVAAFLNLWNAYSRVLTGTVVTDSGSNYVYTSSAPRQARASAGNQINFLVGLAEDAAQFSYSSSYSLLAGTAIRTRGGVGFNTTSAFSRPPFYVRNNNTGVTAEAGGSVAGQWAPGLGLNFIAAVESNPDNTSANTFNLGAEATLEAVIRN